MTEPSKTGLLTEKEIERLTEMAGRRLDMSETSFWPSQLKSFASAIEAEARRRMREEAAAVAEKHKAADYIEGTGCESAYSEGQMCGEPEAIAAAIRAIP